MNHIRLYIRQAATCVFVATSLLSPINVGAFDLINAEAGTESLHACWAPIDGAVRYDVAYAAPTKEEVKVDHRLVRQYPYGYRVDIPGIRPGDYKISIRAYGNAGTLIDEATADINDVRSFTREGFAFTGSDTPGAYKADGTLKDDARVLYVTAADVNDVTLELIKDNKGKTEIKTGLANILSQLGKGFDKRPLAVRIIGSIAGTEFENLKDNNYINLQGNKTDYRFENVTIEGIGEDATLYGYGICFKRTSYVEIRNLGIMLFGDDAISMDTDNHHIWLHNIDFFYGAPGKDADQVKGDGSIDMKYQSTDITIDHNHFFDSGKVMGCGGTTGETENLRITYHHNWFDHADSRCPRLHYTTAHVYNNYYDGVPVYCIGNTTESSAFIESNYFRNCKRPIMTSGQGTDSYDEAKGTYTLKGTFSGQDGGMNKAYDNYFAENTPKLVYQTAHPTQFDAYIVESRDEKIPSTVVSVKGAWPYSNFDTDATMYVSRPDAAQDVPTIVTSRAGRVGGGDFKWTFDNSRDDADHEVNTLLKSAIISYKSSLVAVQGPDGFGSTSGIGAISADAENATTTIYDLTGRRIGNDTTALPAGVYIVKRGAAVYKIKI